jgi:hypothetical protein
MSRIKLNDSAIEILTKMSDGNPGAAQALMDIFQNGVAIDPQNMMGELAPILLLDTWEIYGTDIYVLYNDKCYRNVRRLLVLLRACQMGFLNTLRLKAMASDQERRTALTDEEWNEIDEKVCEALTEFKRP